MTKKTIIIIGWVLSVGIAFIFLSSASSKIFQNESSLQMATGIGLDKNSLLIIGLVELLAIIFFLVPRTAVLGTLLLVAYMGGAIATHLEHSQPLFFPILISCLVWITAVVRLPELRSRLFPFTNS